MMKETIIFVDYKWIGTLEEKLRLTSEYRMIEEQIQDTLDYLDELEKEEARLYSEIMSNMEVKS